MRGDKEVPLVLLAAAALLVAALSGCAPRWTSRREPPPRWSEVGGTPAGRRPAPPADHGGAEAAARPEAARGKAIADLAYQHLGAPYRRGGETPSGFDCSGFVQYLYRRHGVRLPRHTSQQARSGRPVERGELLPGDLVFFRTGGGGISHVGIYIEEVWFIHAPRPGQEVRLDSLQDRYWGPRYAGARRPS